MKDVMRWVTFILLISAVICLIFLSPEHATRLALLSVIAASVWFSLVLDGEKS